MITTSEKWKEYSALHNVYHIKAVLTSTDGTVLNLTDEDFMMGSVKISDSCSSSSSFDIGSVISNTFECTFNNTEGKFDGFNFRLATIAVQFGVIFEDETEEWIDRGVYTLDNPSSLGYTIQVNAYDNMDKLNRAYIGKTYVDGQFVDITFPITSSAMAEALCNYCGVTFGSWMLKNNRSISKFEYNESTSCREVLSWVLQINCGFGRMNPQGELECKWYNPGTWLDVDSLDGGGFNPWNIVDSADGGTMQPWSVVPDIDGGYGVGYLFSQVARSTVGSESIKITGIRTYVPNTVSEYQYGFAGEEGYVLAIDDNPLVTKSRMNSIANTIFSVIGNMVVQPYNADIYGDPAIEAGDPISIDDYLGNRYYSYLTNMTYTLNGLMSCSCGVETVSDRENSYSNPNTTTIQGAVMAAYDYLQAEKISADYISAGTIEASIVAKDLKLEGGSINIETTEEKPDWITLRQATGTGDWAAYLQPSLVGVSYDTNDYADFKNNIRDRSLVEVGYWSGQTNNQVLYADSTGQIIIDGTGSFTLVGTARATSFVNTSRLDVKKNLKQIDSVLDKIKSADILSFNFKDEDENAKAHLGLAIGEDYNTPEEVIAVDEDGVEQGVDLYSMVSMAWKAIQEQQTIIEELEKRIEVLEKKLNPIGNIKDIIKGDNDGDSN